MRQLTIRVTLADESAERIARRGTPLVWLRETVSFYDDGGIERKENPPGQLVGSWEFEPVDGVAPAVWDNDRA